MRVFYEPKRSVVVISRARVEVVMAAVQGPMSVPPETYMSHVAARSNPHEVGLFELLVPAGLGGKWVRFAEGGGLEAVPPPLTEMPVLPPPVDEKVMADPADEMPGFLNGKCAGLVYVDEVSHVLRLRGVMEGSYPPGCYYGTNDFGQLGFWPLPAALEYVCGIGPENEDEWLDTGGVGFFEWA